MSRQLNIRIFISPTYALPAWPPPPPGSHRHLCGRCSDWGRLRRAVPVTRSDVVGMENAEAVEDGDRVQHHRPHRSHRDGAGELMVDANRRLEEAGVAKVPGDNEQLEVEGEPLLDYSR